MKKVTIKRLNATNAAVDADTWVNTRDQLRRFSFDLPASLHTQFKMKCASHGKVMGEVLIGMIEDFVK